MEKSSLTALARQQLEHAQHAASGRSAHTVYGGHEHLLRQTVIALTAGQKLNEHERTPARRPSTSSTGASASPQATRHGRAHPETS